MKNTMIFKRNSEGEIEMYRQVDLSITQEGRNIDNTVVEFTRRLYRVLECLTDDTTLVLNWELQENPTRQVNGY